MVRLLLLSLSISIFILRGSTNKIEGKIVNGAVATINVFPYSAFLFTSCVYETEEPVAWICGSSIVNQNILLTACHCVYGCVRGSSITAYVGSAQRQQGRPASTKRYACHENYDEAIVRSDLALISLYEPLQLNNKINRVALFPRPPYNEKAEIAGWGLINETEIMKTNTLRYVEQYVRDLNYCNETLQNLPKGVFCASAHVKSRYVAQGDSGSPLVVRSYIQIGLVSYKKPSERNLVVYTDVGYYYNWIVKKIRSLICTRRD